MTRATATSYFRSIFKSSNPEEIDEELSDITATVKDSLTDILQLQSYNDKSN